MSAGPPDPGRPLALLVLTRDPSGQMTGRKTVLATAAASLERCGFEVEVLVLSRRPPPQHWHGRRVHHVALPSLPRAAWSGLVVLATRRGSLNEALFDSPDVRRRVRAAARSRGAALVVADGLRTSQPALAAGAPVLVHLDDLLSDRYAALVREQGAADLLGFFGEQIPSVVRPAAQWLARRLVAAEASLTAVRERQLTTQADAVAMTDEQEAAELSRRTGRSVLALPMAVDARPAGDPALADPASFVFLGLLDYAPNRLALAWWTDQVRPVLDALGGEDVHLTVVGHRSDRVDTSDPRLTFTGYVEDLGAELRRHRAMVAPVLTGAGVKTKVLDAWSVGLPVIATPAVAAGFPDGSGLVVAPDAEAFARAVLELRGDAERARRVGAAGRSVLVREWSPEALARRWSAAAHTVLEDAPPRG